MKSWSFIRNTALHNEKKLYIFVWTTFFSENLLWFTFNICPPLCRRVIAFQAAISGSVRGRAKIFNKKRFLSGTGGGGGGAEPQSLIYVPNLSGFNPKTCHRAYDVKAYVLLIAIRLLDGDVKTIAALLVLFNKTRLMPALGFPFTLYHLTFISF